MKSRHRHQCPISKSWSPASLSGSALLAACLSYLWMVKADNNNRTLFTGERERESAEWSPSPVSVKWIMPGADSDQAQPLEPEPADRKYEYNTQWQEGGEHTRQRTQPGSGHTSTNTRPTTTSERERERSWGREKETTVMLYWEKLIARSHLRFETGSELCLQAFLWTQLLATGAAILRGSWETQHLGHSRN